MKKKKHKQRNWEQDQITSTSRESQINYGLFGTIIILVIFSFLLISSISDNQYYNAHHTGLQMLSYLLIFNIAMLLFYNYNFRIFSKTTTKILYILLAMDIVYVYIISIYPVLDLNGDNAAYLARTQSMIEGKGFRNIFLPKEPYEQTLKAMGFSILNIPFVLIFGLDNIAALKLLELISIFVALFYIYKYFENKLERDRLLLLIVVLALFSQIIHFSSIIMTESAALALLFIIMYYTERLILNKNKYSSLKYYIYLSIIAFLIFFSYTVKEALFALFGTIPLYLMIKKRWKELIIVLFIIGILFGVYLKYSTHLKQLNFEHKLTAQTQEDLLQDRSWLEFYVKSFLESGISLKRMWGSILVITQKVAGDPDLHKYDDIALNLIILFIILCGVYRKYLKKLKLSILDLFAPILIIIVTIFFNVLDYVVYSRYYFILIPFAFYYFIQGISLLTDRLKIIPFIGTIIMIFIFSFIIKFHIQSNPAKVYMSEHPNSPPIQNFISACDWLENNTDPSSIVGSRKGTLSYIWAKRKMLPFYDIDKYDRYDLSNIFSQKDAEKIRIFDKSTLDYYKESKVNYILLDNFSSEGRYIIRSLVQKNRGSSEWYTG
jgi:hypothetical protein